LTVRVITGRVIGKIKEDGNMLMTIERPKLTALGAKILEVIAAENGDWVTRRGLVVGLGRPAVLAAHDLNMLNTLIASGYIEHQKHLIGTVRFEHRYRINE